MKKDLIFYDATCSLCNNAIAFILHADKKERFLFAPLEGETAENLLPKPIPQETLILLDRQKRLYTEAKGTLRILWLLGGRYKLIGSLFFFPGFFNPLYRFIAKKRHFLFKSKSPVPFSPDRFLP